MDVQSKDFHLSHNFKIRRQLKKKKMNIEITL